MHHGNPAALALTLAGGGQAPGAADPTEGPRGPGQRGEPGPAHVLRHRTRRRGRELHLGVDHLGGRPAARPWNTPEHLGIRFTYLHVYTPFITILEQDDP